MPRRFGVTKVGVAADMEPDSNEIVTTPVSLMVRVGLVSYSTVQDVMHDKSESGDVPRLAEYALELAGPVETWSRYA